MDILNDIFDTLNLSGALYFRTDFSGPWAITVPDLDQAARFHLVVQGRCVIEFPSGNHLELNPGDLVLVPKGSTHIISDKLGRATAPLETVLDSSGYDGKGVLVIGDRDTKSSTQLICGHFNFRKSADHPILRALPEYMTVTSAFRAEQVWLDDILRLLVRRLFEGDLGSTGVVKRLSESVFIELMRIGFSQSQRLTNILKAFSDKQVGNALELMHLSPENTWTVQQLAKEVGMSRSRFAEKFSQLMDIGPMGYLADWRIQKALFLLDSSKISVQQIALRTGYQSAAAFTRAFVMKVGSTPTEYRQNTI